MAWKDKEIEELGSELKVDLGEPAPFLHEAETKNVAEHGLCWKDQTRYCNASCVAFGDPESAQPIDRCQVLQIEAGKLITLTQLTATVNRILQRLGTSSVPVPPEPPSPFGG